MSILVELVYFAAAVLFIMGLKQMSSPVTARRGIVWAGVGMLAATLITFFSPGLHNIWLIILGVGVGSALAYWSAKRVAMTDMPQMIALYNGMGGGAAGAIAALELVKGDPSHDSVALALAVLGAFIGTVSFSGSLIAYGKLQGILKGGALFAGQHQFNSLLGLLTLGTGIYLVYAHDAGFLVFCFFIGALVFGVLMTTPIGGADMPVVISLYNAFTGLAVAFEGYVLNNPAMIIAGTVVGAAGTLLTQLMAKAMNRSIGHVLFSGMGTGTSDAAAGPVTGTMRAVEANDAAVTMAYASKVIIVPGYGMAVAQAQHKIWEMSKLLIDRGVDVKFAIHPVAGRMPGHMNVLLAEAGVPYDLIHDLEDINAEFPQADVALVIGANDVVNPDARSNKSSPIYGMPILDVDKAHNVIVIKRGQGTGFSGIENILFFEDNCRMLYGDGQKIGGELVSSIKQLQ
jgi:H+-translocating NAD(P) transhydrogenase subunit beta